MWSPLVRSHLSDHLLWPIFSVIITHYKSCWTFYVSSYSSLFSFCYFTTQSFVVPDKKSRSYKFKKNSLCDGHKTCSILSRQHAFSFVFSERLFKGGPGGFSVASFANVYLLINQPKFLNILIMVSYL